MDLCYWVMKMPYLSYLRWTSWSRDRDRSQDTGSEAHLCDSGGFVSHSYHIPILPITLQTMSRFCLSALSNSSLYGRRLWTVGRGIRSS